MNEIGAERSGPVTWARDWLKPLQEALLLTIIAGGVGAAVNLIHPERIPFVAGRDYETMVPCPEPGGEVKVMKPNDPLLSGSDTFVVDARPAEQYAEWHLGAAMKVPYDYLDPTPDDIIRELARRIARSKAKRVVVYGDGDQPDTGEQLGKEISGKGIKHVFFVEGGIKNLKPARKAGGVQ
jgi:hypothetical protein